MDYTLSYWSYRYFHSLNYLICLYCLIFHLYLIFNRNAKLNWFELIYAPSYYLFWLSLSFNCIYNKNCPFHPPNFLQIFWNLQFENKKVYFECKNSYCSAPNAQSPFNKQYQWARIPSNPYQYHIMFPTNNPILNTPYSTYISPFPHIFLLQITFSWSHRSTQYIF